MKVYCDECKFLEHRPIKVERNGVEIVTNKRFYCPIKKKWFSINTTITEVGFLYCEKGEKKE